MTKTLKNPQPSLDTKPTLIDDGKLPADRDTGLPPPPANPKLDDHDDLVVDSGGEPLEEDKGPLYDEQLVQDAADNGGHTLPDEDWLESCLLTLNLPKL